MSASTPKVSVVVATRNRGRLLRLNVESVIAQQYDDFEAIYVDDDSSDETPQLLDSFAAAHGDRLRALHARHHAPGPARNAGVRLARGQYLLFTDDDCVVPPDWVSGMLAHYEARKCDALCGGVAPHSFETRTSRYLHHRMCVLFGDKPKPISAAPMMNFLIPRQLFLEVGGFSEKPWEALEDWDLCHRLVSRKAVLFYDPGVKVVHRYQTEWEPAVARLRATGARAIDVYAESGRSLAGLMAWSTVRALTGPLWSLAYYPLDLWSLSVRVEWLTYRARLQAYFRRILP